MKHALFPLVFCGFVLAQAPEERPAFEAFEVATIKPTPDNWTGGRIIRMTAPQRLEALNFTTRALIAAAFSLTPQAVIGGPGWLDSDHYHIAATTSGDLQPNLDEQMRMVRQLLADRFALTFHREDREFSIYAVTVGRNGHKLKESTASPDDQPYVVNTVYPGAGVKLPARNATMAQFTAMMQRTIFDRPVLDRTGLTGRYDFDLEWAPDETQFGGTLRTLATNPAKPSIFSAMQEQLGLRLESTKGPVLALVIDRIERPTEN